MCTLKSVLLAVLIACMASAATGQEGYPRRFEFGTTPAPAELARFFAVPPDGRGLPTGKGTYAEGQKLYAESCGACHGDKLQGIPTPGIGGDKLIGGRGTLNSTTPVKTIESYWPYATTLFDYIKRAMPFHSPGSLSDDQVYSVVAYILGEANIVPKNATLDGTALPKVVMPNRDGFVPDPRPEIELYR